MTPSPFIRIFLDNGEDILVDIDSKTKEEINEHLRKIICKSDQASSSASSSNDTDGNIIMKNPGHFGWGCRKQCMCEVFGQVPCPMVVQLPKKWRGKYIYNPELLEEEEENN